MSFVRKSRISVPAAGGATRTGRDSSSSGFGPMAQTAGNRRAPSTDRSGKVGNGGSGASGLSSTAREVGLQGASAGPRHTPKAMFGANNRAGFVASNGTERGGPANAAGFGVKKPPPPRSVVDRRVIERHVSEMEEASKKDQVGGSSAEGGWSPRVFGNVNDPVLQKRSAASPPETSSPSSGSVEQQQECTVGSQQRGDVAQSTASPNSRIPQSNMRSADVAIRGHVARPREIARSVGPKDDAWRMDASSEQKRDSVDNTKKTNEKTELNKNTQQSITGASSTALVGGMARRRTSWQQKQQLTAEQLRSVEGEVLEARHSGQFVQHFFYDPSTTPRRDEPQPVPSTSGGKKTTSNSRRVSASRHGEPDSALGYYACARCTLPLLPASAKIRHPNGYATFTAAFRSCYTMSVVMAVDANVAVAMKCQQCCGFIGHLAWDDGRGIVKANSLSLSFIQEHPAKEYADTLASIQLEGVSTSTAPTNRNTPGNGLDEYDDDEDNDDNDSIDSDFLDEDEKARKRALAAWGTKKKQHSTTTGRVKGNNPALNLKRGVLSNLYGSGIDGDDTESDHSC